MVTAPVEALAGAEAGVLDPGVLAGALEAGAAEAAEGAVVAPLELQAATNIPAAMTVVNRRARFG
jgi:hypothetical protein